MVKGVEGHRIGDKRPYGRDGTKAEGYKPPRKGCPFSLFVWLILLPGASMTTGYLLAPVVLGWFR